MEPRKKFIPFKERGEKWADLEPVPQFEEGQAPIAPVPY